jgi:iron(III) transport system substrate-binding protein
MRDNRAAHDAPVPLTLENSMNFPRRTLLCLATAAAVLVSGGAWAQKTELLVYTALETDQLKAYGESFAKMAPDVELKFVRDSTGVIIAKLLAEKANPQADVILGVAASGMEIFKAEGMLTPYSPKDFDKLNAIYSDKSRPPSWVGQDVYAAAVCFNTVEAAKKGIPKPETWKDLLKPVYKGQIVMPNPASSGTGYFDVTAWLQLFGEDGGWKYMDGLHENIAQYMHSGSRPCAAAANGEYVVGISFEYRANREKAQGKPVDLVFPKEGLGWDLEAIGIYKGTKNMAAAQKLMDWAASDAAMALYAKNFAIVAVPSQSQPLPNVPANYGSMLVKNDFDWASKNRDKILAEWSKRYESKAAPK